MKEQTSEIGELQDLLESLEVQRRKALTLILDLQDAGASSEDLERVKIKLMLINHERGQYTAAIKSAKEECMGKFSTPKTIEAIKKVFGKAETADLKAAIRVRDEAEVKLQVLMGRQAKFETQKTGLAAEIESLKAKISQVLHEGGDPGEVNRQVRAATQEIEDLDNWIAQLQKSAIPEAQKVLSEAEVQVWLSLGAISTTVKATYSKEMNNHLAVAAEIWHSWQTAVQQIFGEHGITKPPTPNDLSLVIDKQRTFFGTVQFL